MVAPKHKRTPKAAIFRYLPLNAVTLGLLLSYTTVFLVFTAELPFEAYQTIKAAELQSTMPHGDDSSSVHRVVHTHERNNLLPLVNDKKREHEPQHSSIATRGIASQHASDTIESVILLGLVRYTEEVQNNTWSLLKDLSCGHQVSIHIIAQGIDSQHQNLSESMQFCAPIFLECQDELLLKDVSNTTRLHRIAQIRDAQRERARKLFFSRVPSETTVVVLMDLDLWELPSAEQILHRLHRMNGMDVVCGAGNWFDSPAQQKKRLFYYDNFAFVSWPDTFGFPAHQRLIPGFPAHQRLIPQYYKGEESAIIPYSLSRAKRLMKEGQQPVPTQYTLFQFLQNRAAQSPSGLAPSRSCFGGLAMYRANVWLTPQCSYNLFSMASPPEMSFKAVVVQSGHENNILRYASAKELLPCEHVVFHDCLHREAFADSPNPSSPHMGVDPQLVTHWKRNSDDPTKPPHKEKKKSKKHVAKP